MVFQRWGMPVLIKVDNGQPFGDPQKKTIPVLALWLMSLKIKVIWNRPRQPRDNAKVERMQGTSKRWVDLDRCTSRPPARRTRPNSVGGRLYTAPDAAATVRTISQSP